MLRRVCLASGLALFASVAPVAAAPSVGFTLTTFQDSCLPANQFSKDRFKVGACFAWPSSLNTTYAMVNANTATSEWELDLFPDSTCQKFQSRNTWRGDSCVNIRIARVAAFTIDVDSSTTCHLKSYADSTCTPPALRAVSVPSTQGQCNPPSFDRNPTTALSFNYTADAATQTWTVDSYLNDATCGGVPTEQRTGVLNTCSPNGDYLFCGLFDEDEEDVVEENEEEDAIAISSAPVKATAPTSFTLNTYSKSCNEKHSNFVSGDVGRCFGLPGSDANAIVRVDAELNWSLQLMDGGFGCHSVVSSYSGQGSACSKMGDSVFNIVFTPANVTLSTFTNGCDGAVASKALIPTNECFIMPASQVQDTMAANVMVSGGDWIIELFNSTNLQCQDRFDYVSWLTGNTCGVSKTTGFAVRIDGFAVTNAVHQTTTTTKQRELIAEF